MNSFHQVFSQKSCKRLSSPPHALHAKPIFSSRFYHPNNIVWVQKIMNLCSFLHSTRYLFVLRPKYRPQHPIFKHPHPSIRATKFHAHTKQVTVVNILIFMFNKIYLPNNNLLRNHPFRPLSRWLPQPKHFSLG